MRTPSRRHPPQRRKPPVRYRQRYSLLRRSGIATALILLGIYALMQHYVPHWFDTPPPAVSTAQNSTPHTPATLTGHGRELYIFDGDTIALHGQRIRLKGMDTPEGKQSCKANGKTYPCGDYATAALRKLIGNQAVTCTSDGRDKYNRILGFCRAGETDLNRTLVQQGWAVSYGLYQKEEAQARKAGLGLWAGEFERPSKWRAKQRNKNQ